MNDFYTIGQVVQFTGLTDRTIRNYIASGILEGEKIDGLWHFTPEQVEAFVRHPSVRPSILAKKNALVYDFLLDTQKKTKQICMILDNEKEASDFFCRAITNGEFKNIKFSFDTLNDNPRVILKGDATEVLQLVNLYHSLP